MVYFFDKWTKRVDKFYDAFVKKHKKTGHICCKCIRALDIYIQKDLVLCRSRLSFIHVKNLPF